MAVQTLAGQQIPIRDKVVDEDREWLPAWHDYWLRLPFTLRMAVNPPAGWLTKATDFTHNSSGSGLAYPADTANEDNDGICNITLSRLDCKTPGVYWVWCTGRYASNVTGQRALSLRLNGVVPGPAYIASDVVQATNGDVTSFGTASMQRLAVGDYVELITYQNSGGNLVVTAGYTKFGMQWWRP